MFFKVLDGMKSMSKVKVSNLFLLTAAAPMQKEGWLPHCSALVSQRVSENPHSLALLKEFIKY